MGALVMALVIDWKLKVPTMPIGTYLNLTWLVVCIVIAASADTGFLEDFFGWFWVGTAGPWLVLNTLLHLTNRSTKQRLAWSTNFAAIVYTVGIFLVLGIFNFYSESWWQWTLLTLLVVPPL